MPRRVKLRREAGLARLAALYLQGKSQVEIALDLRISQPRVSRDLATLPRRTKRMVEWLHNTALRVYGRQAYAGVEFERIRKTDRKAETEADRLETDTLVAKVHAGWLTNDKAAQQSIAPMPHNHATASPAPSPRLDNHTPMT